MGFNGIISLVKFNGEILIRIKSGFLEGQARLNETEIKKLKSFVKEL